MNQLDSLKKHLSEIATFSASEKTNFSAQAIQLLITAETVLKSEAVNSVKNEFWHLFLKITGKSNFLQAFETDRQRYRWADVAFKIIQISNFSMFELFEQRVNEHPKHTLFQDMKSSLPTRWSYEQIHRYTREIAAIFYRMQAEPRVAIFAENSVDSASCDLACLTNDIFDTPLNVHFKSETLKRIFNLLKINIVVTDTPARAKLLKKLRNSVDVFFQIFVFDPKIPVNNEDCFFLGERCKQIGHDEINEILQKRKRKPVGEVATTMFTSGSTGIPKGVSFSYYNLVSKRFARAAALPKVGNNEVMLCFLPLFHTFGRYLEMLGSIYWSGTYVFTGNTSTETLLSLFPKVIPTGFISIPLRWTQLFDKCMSQITDPDQPEQREKQFRQVVGKRLRWGLSAAGCLAPETFQFFENNKVELCSGFGMTEATGGITMTEPGNYVSNSVGIPLPGTFTSFGENNELLIGGHYIARYLDDAAPGEKIDFPSEKNKFWLPTGDIFRINEAGHYEIIDRVKDIYKNNKGQTIAPRVVEKKFEGVPGIKRTFLVGDAQPYNVVLIVADLNDPIFKSSGDKKNIDEYFHRIVTAANKDIAPYERVINFAILERDFQIEKKELTAKGTFNRKVIEKNFKELISTLYVSNTVKLSRNGIEIAIPRWFYRDLGILEDDIIFNEKGLFNRSNKLQLCIEHCPDVNGFLIGDLIYTIGSQAINMGVFARQPRLWIGNPALIDFCPCKEGWDLPLRKVSPQVVRPKNIAREYAIGSLIDLGHIRDQQLVFINNLISTALFSDSKNSLIATEEIGNFFGEADERIADVIRRRLEALSRHQAEEVRAAAYRILLLKDPDPDFSNLFPTFIQSGLTFLNEKSISEIAIQNIGKQHLEALRKRLYTYRTQLKWPADQTTRKQFENILKLIFNFAGQHLEYYISIRAELAIWILHTSDPGLSRLAKRYFLRLYQIFEKHIVETSDTYTEADWDKRLFFDSGISEKEIAKIKNILVGSSFLKQSIIAAYDEREFELKDIQENGIWVTALQSVHQYQHYRFSINTTSKKHFDLHFMINNTLHLAKGKQTVYWLAALSGHPYGSMGLPPLGCCRIKEGVLTTKFVGELTAWEKIREYAGIHHSLGYLNKTNAWKKLFIKSLSQFFKAWKISGRRIIPGIITPENVVVPELDYLDSATIISLGGWESYENPSSLVKPMLQNFYNKVIAHYPWCNRHLKIDWIFDSCIEAFGDEEAMEFFSTLHEELKIENPIYWEGKELFSIIKEYMSKLEEEHYLPVALFNSIDQYKEWENMNPAAVQMAREQTVTELISLYKLYHFSEVVRYTFYRYTYFKDFETVVLESFDKLLEKMNKNAKTSALQLIELSDLQEKITQTDDKLVFSKMIFPRLEGVQSLDVVKVGDEQHKKVIVRSFITDRYGAKYTFRKALAPSEIGKLYRLFYEENYPKTISEMDEHYVVTDSENRVVGGMCYIQLENNAVLLDGSAVTAALKGRGIGSAMIEHFCTRMTNQGVKIVKAHFLRGNFYLKLGFKVDKRWGALVRFLK